MMNNPMLRLLAILCTSTQSLQGAKPDTPGQELIKEAISFLPDGLHRRAFGHVVIVVDLDQLVANMAGLKMSEVADKAAFVLGEPAQFPIYVRADSKVFRAALGARNRFHVEVSPFTLFLTALIRHELAHVLSAADEVTALKAELEMLRSLDALGLFNGPLRKAANVDGYISIIEMQINSECRISKLNTGCAANRTK
jgi:hypothetical protein